MPTGRVKWYDAEKGFGFLSQEDGEDVYIRSSALPDGVEALKSGQRVEFGVASGRRGPQALSLKLIDPPPSPLRPRPSGPAEHKHSPDELHGMVYDMITLLEERGAAGVAQGPLSRSQDRAAGVGGREGRRAGAGLVAFLRRT